MAGTAAAMVKGLPEMEEGQIKSLVEKIEHDLLQQLSKHEVPLHAMAVLADAGFTSSK